MTRGNHKKSSDIQLDLDKQKKTSRAYKLFKSAIKTKPTLRAYNHGLDQFVIYSGFTGYEQIVKKQPKIIQEKAENFILELVDQGKKAVTIRQYLAGVELFFQMNKMLYHPKVLKNMIPSSDYKKAGNRPYTNEEIKLMLDTTTKLRTKAAIHFFASTGARPASIEDPILRMEHIEDMPKNCKAVKLYDDSSSEYWAFLTPEASRALDNYHQSRKNAGEIFTQQTPVFARSMEYEKVKHDHLTEVSLSQMFRDSVRKAGIQRNVVTKVNNERAMDRYDLAAVYGFRKRFNTILKINNEVNSNIAEKLMAHKRGLDGVYLQPTRDECFAEFAKAIHDLTIDDLEREKVKSRKLEAEKTELQQKVNEIENLKKQQQKDREFMLDYLDSQMKKMRETGYVPR